MSADVVNLRRLRKARVRSDREAAAAENRAAFGRSKAEKQRDEAERQRAAHVLESHLRDKPRK